jgi:hypothetical protein
MRASLVPALCLALLGLVARQAPAEEPRPTVKELVAVLGDPDRCYDSKLDALRALEPFGREAEAAVPAVKEFLRCRDPELQLQAVRCLRAVGKPAVPALAEALNGDPQDAVPKLAKKQGWTVIPRQGRDGRLREAVAEALASLGPDAREAVPALLEWMASGDPAADEAVSVLPKVGAEPKEFVPAAVRVVKNWLPERDRWASFTAEAAIRTLAEAGPAAKEAVPVLVEVIEGYPASGTRTNSLIPATFAALAAIGADAGPALPALRGCLSDRGYGKDAEQAIARIKASQKKD